MTDTTPEVVPAATTSDAKVEAPKTEKRAEGRTFKAPTLLLTQIHADPARNDRTDLGNISDLAASIKKEGIIQPLVISDEPREDGKYELVAGYRRYNAAKMAGLKEVPVVSQSVDSLRRRRVQLIENLHREDMNPLDKANSIHKMMEEEKMESQKEAAEALGLSAGAISQYMSLLNLPSKVQAAVKSGKVDFTVARELTRLKDEEKIVELLPEAQKMSVSDVKNKVDFLLQKQKEKEEKEADKAKAREKAKKTPTVGVQAEASEEEEEKDLATSVKELGFEPLKKTDLLMQIVAYANKFSRAKTEESKAENRHILHGLAIAAGVDFKKLLNEIS